MSYETDIMQSLTYALRDAYSLRYRLDEFNQNSTSLSEDINKLNKNLELLNETMTKLVTILATDTNDKTKTRVRQYETTFQTITKPYKSE